MSGTPSSREPESGSHAHATPGMPDMHQMHEHPAADTATREGHDMHDMPGMHEGHDMQHMHDMGDMHDMPGMPGMDHTGHSGHTGHVAVFRRLFWIMLVLAVPVVTLSPMFAMLVGYSLPDWRWLSFVSPVLGTVMYAWGGRPFLQGAVSEIRARKPGMMLLIGLAITVAFLSSLGASVGLLDHQLDFWWELALLIVIMLLGHWVEMRSLAQTSSALDSLAALLPDEAEVIDEHGTRTVSPSELAVGEVVLVRPGGRVPADGTIASGSASVDESMITGESRAVLRSPGDPVVAGTIATDSSLHVTVTAVGPDTALAGIRRLVQEAQESSSRSQRIADRAAALLFWFALAAAVVTAVVWSLLGRPDDAIVRTITVLVIACPHALGLAIPLVVSIATERAARAGVLVKDRLALEEARLVDVVVFDKTGTLTLGEPTVTDVVAVPGETRQSVLALAAAAEADSEHPLAHAILAAFASSGAHRLHATAHSSSPAVGVRADVDGRRVSVGGPALLAHENATALEATSAWSDAGAIVLHVVVDGAVRGAIRLSDAVRPESSDAVKALHRLGVRVVMITGDAEPVARQVADELGIDQVFAQVRPEDKAGRVRELQEGGHRVAMVGDGVNDAPALAAADVGIAIGAGTDVAIASAGVILASSDPRSVLSVIRLSTATYRKMQQNLWWAAGYNLLAVPLAAGVLAPVGFVLPMSVGAILMSLSTVVVAANAQLLRRIDLGAETSVRAILGDGAQR